VLADHDHSETGISDTISIHVATTPTITIDSPVDGAVVSYAGDVTLTVSTTDFTFDPAAVGQIPEPAYGHWHLYVDGAYVDYGITNTYPVSGLSEGAHTITAMLADHDHTELGISDSVTVTVLGMPTVAITSPSQVAVADYRGDVTVAVATTNFTLDDDSIGAPNEDGVGHWHLYDGDPSAGGTYLGATGDASFDATGLSQGAHTLFAELAENDHTGLGIWDSVDITVPAAPTILIADPMDGASISHDGDFTVSVTVTGFSLDDAAVGGANEAGHGHWHLYVDGAYSDYGGTTSYDVSGLATGGHTLEARLADNDHVELGISSGVVDVTVLPTPTVSIDSPANGADVDFRGELTLAISATDFTFDAAGVDAANEAGHGHYHVFVDGAYAGYGTDSTYALTGLVPGSAPTLTVELAENDHTLWAITDSIGVNVLPAPTIALTIDTTPEGDGSFNTSSIEATVDVTDFVLDPGAVGGASVAGEGHYHLLVDGGYVDYDADSYAVFADLTEGSHALTVELVDNEHDPIGVSDGAVVVVTAGRPAISIDTASLVQDDVLDSSSLSFHILVENFTLDGAAIGSAAVAGEGHVHVLVDGVYYAAEADETIEVTDLDAGAHEIVVGLQGNDHLDLAPPVMDYVRFTVTSDRPRISIDGLEGVTDTSDVNTASPMFHVSAENFTLDAAAIDGPNVTDEGHFHVYVDGAYAFAATEDFHLEGLDPGDHTVRLVLADNDHTELAVWDDVAFTVSALRPEVTITNTLCGGTSCSILVSWENFTMSSAVDAGDGDGHYHVMVDGVYYAADADNFTTITGLSAGAHTLEVSLSEDFTHLELTPAVFYDMDVSL
jgi:hypothetical protein